MPLVGSTLEAAVTRMPADTDQCEPLDDRFFDHVTMTVTSFYSRVEVACYPVIKNIIEPRFAIT
jgi:hypothetical protein